PAARLHEERVTRELEQAAGGPGGVRAERSGGLAREPVGTARGLEEAVDVPVTRAPRIPGDVSRRRLVERRELVPEPVERRAERPAPPRRPVAGPANAPPAARPPALDAVHATPRRPLRDLDLVRRGMMRAERRRSREHDVPLRRQRPEREGERHLAE